MSDTRKISDNEKYCSHCGAVILKAAEICPKCGCRVASVQNVAVQNAYYEQDSPSFGFAVLGFLIPLLGLILYIMWKNETPLKAKSCGKGALLGFILNVVCGIIFTCVVSAGASKLL